MSKNSRSPPLSSIPALIPHIQQTNAWDCGLACIAMILTAFSQPQSPIHLAHLVPSRSIWTIDLAYLLKHHQIPDFTYYTSYIGVNWGHATHHFYKQEMSRDRQRIHFLFANAHSSNVRVVPVILGMSDMARFLLSSSYALILLVDLAFLECSRCSQDNEKNQQPKFVDQWKSILNAASLFFNNVKSRLNCGGCCHIKGEGLILL